MPMHRNYKQMEGYDDEEMMEILTLIEKLHSNKFPRRKSSSSERRINTVPQRLKEQNVSAYTPQVVSIGHIHYNNNHKYSQMEGEKRKYLDEFLVEIRMSLEDALQFIKDRETRFRNCYKEDIVLDSDKLAKVVLVDAVFALIFMCGGSEELRLEYKRSSEVIVGWTWIEEVHRDLILLENQLPFFIFEDLFELVCTKRGIECRISFHSCCYDKFNFFRKQEPKQDDIPKPIHIIDLLRFSLRPSSGSGEELYDYVHAQIIPTATELNDAGVKFREGSNGTLLDIEFKHGVLKIPQIFVGRPTEMIFRNILAYEYHCDERYVTQYIFFMKSLIKSPKDVDVLVENHIMVNNLSSSESASTFFHSLGEEITVSKTEIHYLASICRDLNAYRNRSLHRWMANLKHNYLDTPWKVMSVLAAILLLGLTTMQTIYTMLTYYGGGK